MLDDIKPIRPRSGMPQQTNQNTENIAVMPAPAFMTPEQVAARDSRDELPPPQSTAHRGKAPRGPKKWIAKWKRLSRNKKIVIISALVGLLIGGGLIWWFVLRGKPMPAMPVIKEETKQAEEPPKPIVSRLTGVKVTTDQEKLPVTGIMIENSPDARPQAGVYEAGVVYEAIAEGGITRFLTLFQETVPGYIGPVRSVRPYYLDFLAPYDAPIVHAGGSGPALAQVKSEGFKDIDHGANASLFQRVNNRFAPHNLYTNRQAIINLQNSKGWGTSTFTGFVRKADQPSATPNAKTVDVTISGALYNSHYDYDAASNSYLRSEGGRPHMDEKTAKQLNPKVVVAIVTTHRYDGIYSVYGVTGKGDAYVFQDGSVTKGTWEKANRKSQYKFSDASGASLGLNAGQTWVTMVTGSDAIKHAP